MFCMQSAKTTLTTSKLNSELPKHAHQLSKRHERPFWYKFAMMLESLSLSLDKIQKIKKERRGLGMIKTKLCLRYDFIIIPTLMKIFDSVITITSNCKQK